MAVSNFAASGSSAILLKGYGTTSASVPAGTYKYTSDGNVSIGGNSIEPGNGLVTFSSAVTSCSLGGKTLTYLSKTNPPMPGNITKLYLPATGSKIYGISQGYVYYSSNNGETWSQGGYAQYMTTSPNSLTAYDYTVTPYNGGIYYRLSDAGAWAQTGLTGDNAPFIFYDDNNSRWFYVIKSDGGSYWTSYWTPYNTPHQNMTTVTQQQTFSTTSFSHIYTILKGDGGRFVATLNSYNGISGRIMHSTSPTSTTFSSMSKFQITTQGDVTHLHYSTGLNKYYGFRGSSTILSAPTSTAFSALWDTATLPNYPTNWTPAGFAETTNRYVFAGYQGYGYTSSDGINWTRISISPTTENITSIIYKNGKFMAMSSAYKMYISTDGVNFSADSLFSNTVMASNSENSKLMFLDSGGNIAISSDGLAFTTSKPMTGGNDIAYGDNKYVVVRDNSSGNAYYSTDGISWTDCTINTTGNQSVAFGNGKFVIQSNATFKVATSSSMSFTSISPSLYSDGAGISFDGTKFIALGFDSNQRQVIAISYDGLSWTANTSIAEFEIYSTGNTSARFRINQMRKLNNKIISTGYNFANMIKWISQGSDNTLEPKLHLNYSGNRANPMVYHNGVYALAGSLGLSYGESILSTNTIQPTPSGTTSPYVVGGIGNMIITGNNDGTISRFTIGGETTLTLEKVG